MSMLSEDLDDFDVEDMAKAFKNHTNTSRNHVIMVTSYRICEECGGSCDDDGDGFVNIFSSWERVVEYMQSLPEGVGSDLDPIIIDAPEFGGDSSGMH